MAGARSHPLVLIVDDDVTMRLLARASLEKAGFAVAEAKEGLAGLAEFQSLHPDLILLDVLMPGMDGFTTCAQLRQLPGGEHTPILMATGLNDLDSINRAFEVGATDFITKPLNWTILCYRVRYMLRAHQAMKQRQELEDQLHQSQKMEAIGRLAGGVAHDFNNLLMVIMNDCELMLSQFTMPEPVPAHIEEIQKAAEQAASLTRQLLAFSRKQVLLPKIFDLGAVVTDMEEFLKRLIGEDVQIKISLGTEPALVKADFDQIKQVLLNLAVNARDAMPGGGKLTIELVHLYLDEEYCQSRGELQPGPYVMLSVSDDGLGMDQEIQARIFEPFFTTKERDKGTGLGLSTVHGIIKQSGGHISVYSEAGHGSTFKIYLPQSHEPVPEAKLEQHRQVTSLKGSETILIVEDETLLRRTVRRILETYGYNILEAGTGEEALNIGAKHAGFIDLLFTDVIMPGMNGKELEERWVRLSPNTKVLFTSGYTEYAIVHQGKLEAGINFIQKPCRPIKLAEKIREILDMPENPGTDEAPVFSS